MLPQLDPYIFLFTLRNKTMHPKYDAQFRLKISKKMSTRRFASNRNLNSKIFLVKMSDAFPQIQLNQRTC